MSTLFGKFKRKRARIDDGEKEPVLTAATTSTSTSTSETLAPSLPYTASFHDLGLAEPLVDTCRELGFRKPTPVQRSLIPFLLSHTDHHVLALASTGSGKTAAFLLPILQHLIADPYGIYAVVLTPTRELAKQIHQQVVALGSAFHIQSALVVGGLDSVRQSCALDRRPHICVATPGRLAAMLRGPQPPRIKHVRYIVLDEADRLLVPNSGFEKDVAELLLHCSSSSSDDNTITEQRAKRQPCQTLLFSASMTRSLESILEIAGDGLGRLPLKKFVIQEGMSHGDESSSQQEQKEQNGTETANKKPKTDTESTIPKIPAGLKQEYIFMPSRVRDAYLLTTIRALMAHGGKSPERVAKEAMDKAKPHWKRNPNLRSDRHSKDDNDDEEEDQSNKARSAIIFVATCERAAMVSGILSHVGVDNVALHSLLSQNRRLASLAKFKSQQVRVLVATDVASRGLDIPTVDLVLNAQLPRSPVSYVHRVGRTARAGRRGRAISLVAESEVSLVHAAERVSGRSLEKCTDVTDDMAIQLLGAVTKAARLTKMKLMEIGFDELVTKFKERKARDKKERDRIEKALKKIET